MADNNIDTTQIKNLLGDKLTECGFKAFGEFSGVDSLIYKDSFVAYYSFKGIKAVGSCIAIGTFVKYTEADCTFEIRLMGKSCEYADYESFAEMCEKLYGSLAADKNFIIKNMEMGKAYQSMPLKRLAKDMTLTVRLCLCEGGYK